MQKIIKLQEVSWDYSPPNKALGLSRRKKSDFLSKQPQWHQK